MVVHDTSATITVSVVLETKESRVLTDGGAHLGRHPNIDCLFPGNNSVGTVGVAAQVAIILLLVIGQPCVECIFFGLTRTVGSIEVDGRLLLALSDLYILAAQLHLASTVCSMYVVGRLSLALRDLHILVAQLQFAVLILLQGIQFRLLTVG